MGKSSKTVAAVAPSVAILSMIKVGDVERVPLAQVMTGNNYSRPGWNATAPTGVDALADHLLAVGQMNPALVMTGEGGRFNLVAGFRRFAALSMLHKRGKTDGTILVRRVTLAPGADLPVSAVAPLVNLMENEDAKVGTGLAGRLAVYSELRKASVSAARIASLTGQSAVDYVADTLRLIDPTVDPRFRYAVEAHEDGREAFAVTVPGKDKDGKDAPAKVKGTSAPFGLVRLIVRAAEFHHGTEAEAGDRFTAWEVFRKVAHLPISKATPVITELKAGRAAVAKAEEEAKAVAEAARLQKAAEREASGKERGAGDNNEATVAADDFRETAATLTVPVLLDIRAALAGDKADVAKALDLIAKALGKGGAFVKAYGAAYVEEAIDAAS
jgi:hypothetical protein